MSNLVCKIPEDMDRLRDDYEGKNPREGTCGPTIVAFLTGKLVQEVIDSWSIPYRGYCSLGELRRELSKCGIETSKALASYKNKVIQLDGVNKVIGRIQWKKKYSSWKIPEKNTHFIYIEKNAERVRLFDNTVGWFDPNSSTGTRYALKGRITNFLVIE